MTTENSGGGLQFFRLEDGKLIHDSQPYSFVVSDAHRTKEGIRAGVSLYHERQLIGQDSLVVENMRRRRQFLKACHDRHPQLDIIRLEDLLVILGNELGNHLTELEKDADYLANAADQPEPLSEELRQAALKILKVPSLLLDINKIIYRLGLAGEKTNRLLIYLCCCSRILLEPISIVVKGVSSAGKSYLIKIVLKLFPFAAYKDLTDATPQSFFYMRKDELKHRVVVILEIHGGQKSQYSIRALQSEGKLCIQYPRRDQKTGTIRTTRVEIEGPVSFLTTTTQARIHGENETRNLSIFVDDSEEQTARALKMASRKYSGELKSVAKDELEEWRAVQSVLQEEGSKPVYIPYIDMLEACLPIKVVRVRRDYHKLLALIETIVNLHRYQRKTVVIHEEERLVATAVDYFYAKTLIEHVLADTIYELSPASRSILEACRQLDAQRLPLTHRNIANKLGWLRRRVARAIEPLISAGFLEQHSGGGHGFEAGYELVISSAGDFMLPSLEELLKKHPELTRDMPRCFDLVTGKEIQILSKKVKKVSALEGE